MKEKGYENGELTDKPLDEELQEEGFTPVRPENYNPSDEGEEALSLENQITVAQIFEKRPLRLARVSPRQERVLRGRFIEGKFLQQVASEEKPRVSRERVRQIQSNVLDRLKRVLPPSQRREKLSKYQREIAKSLVMSYLYPNDPNRFLMVEYLFDYFLKRGFDEFTFDEKIVLGQVRHTHQEQLENRLLPILNRPDFVTDRRGKKYEKVQVNSLLRSTFDKVRKIIAKKFN